MYKSTVQKKVFYSHSLTVNLGISAGILRATAIFIYQQPFSSAHSVRLLGLQEANKFDFEQRHWKHPLHTTTIYYLKTQTSLPGEYGSTATDRKLPRQRKPFFDTSMNIGISTSDTDPTINRTSIATLPCFATLIHKTFCEYAATLHLKTYVCFTPHHWAMKTSNHIQCWEKRVDD